MQEVTVNPEAILITVIVFLLLCVVYLLMKSGNKKSSGHSDSSLKLIQEQMMHMSKTLDSKLSDSSKMMSDNMNKTFATSTKINEQSNKRIEDITKKLTQLEEWTQQIKDIWGQLRWLENILKNPKQRWNLGEYFLKELLENVFTQDQYQLQYSLGKIGIVDAALFIGDKIIPIDAKFPQENYERLIKTDDDFAIEKYSKDLKKDIKNRIDETSKYISEVSGTTDFAFMLIPAEGMYYDLFINKLGNIEPKKLIEYGFSKKVIICSPSWFYAYLQTVMQGMKALQIEAQAKEIQKYVIKLQKDLSSYEDLFSKLWNSLGTTVNHYNNASKRLKIIDKDVVKITDGQAGGESEILSLEKPDM